MTKNHTDKKTPKTLDKDLYEKELERLQTELVRMQEWIKQKGLKVVVVFEGRDAAGKGGIIKRIKERVSARVFRVVALPAPRPAALARRRARPRRQARLHRYRLGTLVHRGYQRQATRKAQLHLTFAEPHSLQEHREGTRGAAQAQQQGEVRRRGGSLRAPLGTGSVLTWPPSLLPAPTSPPP